MKPMSLNLSRFRKVREDGDTSTFQSHDAPHEITIAHKALPRDMRTYLKALPLYAADKADPEQALAPKMASGGKIADALKDKQKFKSDAPKEKMADAFKKRAHYADGAVDASQNDIPNPTPTTDDEASPQDNPPPPININIGTPNVGVSGDGAQGQNTQVPQAPHAQTPAQDANPQTPQQNPNLDQAQAQLNQLQGGAPEAKSPELSAQNLPSVNEGPGFLQGYQQKAEGLREQAQATGALGTKEAAIEQKRADALDDIAGNYEKAYGITNKLREESVNNIQNNQVDPNAYWDNHSKFFTGLGLLIGGFNPGNRPNSTLQFLNQAIQRDTYAQKINLGSQESILSQNMQMFGNLKAATDFTNVLKQDWAASKLRQAAAKAQNPLQAAKFNQDAGQLEMESAKALIPLSAMQGAFQSMRQGTDPSPILPSLRLAAPEYSKSIEDHLYPGEGYSDKPIPPDVSNSIQKQRNILIKTQRLQDWIDSNTVKGQLSPAHRGEGEALAAELAQFYRQGTGASTSESEQKTIGSFIDQKPGGFLSAYINDPKLHALSGSMKDSVNTIHNAYGFHPFTNTQGARIPTEAPTQNVPHGTIQNKSGVPYRKVPGGWQPI